MKWRWRWRLRLRAGCGCQSPYHSGGPATSEARQAYRRSKLAPDTVSRALEHARANARQAGAHVRFLQADITTIGAGELGASYTLLLDGGCLHGLAPAQLRHAADTVTDTAKAGATLLMFAFAPGRRGPAPAASTPHRYPSSSRNGSLPSAAPPARSRCPGHCATPGPAGTSSSSAKPPPHIGHRSSPRHPQETAAPQIDLICTPQRVSAKGAMRCPWIPRAGKPGRVAGPGPGWCRMSLLSAS